jgi:hypothetical protein
MTNARRGLQRGQKMVQVIGSGAQPPKIAKRSCYDSVFYAPKSGAHRGRDEIDRVAGAIKASHPDFQYQLLAEPEEFYKGGSQEKIHLPRPEFFLLPSPLD